MYTLYTPHSLGSRYPVYSPHKIIQKCVHVIMSSWNHSFHTSWKNPQIAKFMGPTWGPPGSCRPQMGPMLAPWTLLSGSRYSNSLQKAWEGRKQIRTRQPIHVLPWRPRTSLSWHQRCISRNRLRGLRIQEHALICKKLYFYYKCHQQGCV